MKGFLRFAGVIELILYIAGIIIYALSIPFTGANIFYFVLFIVLGPTIAVLLFAVAQILENTEYNERKIDKIDKKISLLSKLNPSIEKEVKKVDIAIEESNYSSNTLNKLSVNYKNEYKNNVIEEYNRFPIDKCSRETKKEIGDVRDEALKMIEDSKTLTEAEAVVKSFKEVLKDYKQ